MRTEARERPVNGDEVRDARFLNGDGYDAAHVDDLLRRVAVELDAGRPAGPLIAGATFPRRGWRWSPAYDIGAVDWFLDQLPRRENPSPSPTSSDPWRDLAVVNHFTRGGPGDLAERTAAPSRRALRKYGTQDRKYLADECAVAWRDLGQQPAPHLRWVRTGTARRELRTEDEQTIAARHGWDIAANITVSTGGRTVTLKRVTGSSGPGIAQIAASHAQDLKGHFLRAASLPRWFPGARRIEASLAQGPAQAPVRELVDEAGMPILYTSELHLHEHAGACITFDEQRWLRFPVRGTHRTNAIMTAVDHAGTKIARYRLVAGKRRWKGVEITVHAGQLLTDELVLAIALSAPWLRSYFSHPPEGH